jgi:hypothetical protein
MFLTHRWMGVALSLLMLMWTLSGVVMMYVSFPQTTNEERLAGLEPLDLNSCCAAVRLPPEPLEGATVEMMAGRPVLRWRGADGDGLVDLRSGAPARVGPAEARRIAEAYMVGHFQWVPAMALAPGGLDQWTVYGQFRAYAPLYKASFADARGTVLYVSARNGEVVQDTSAPERFWNWLGAVPHWLYFTALRQNGALWSNVVIYASLLGAFLTVTGLYVGIVMYGRARRKSPFRGIALWHHWTGLVFGIATLTWVFSGFASMTPWHWLESAGPRSEVAALRGRALAASDVEAMTGALAAHRSPGAVSAEVALQGGRVYAIVAHADGSRERVSLPALAPAAPSDGELASLAVRARPRAAVASQGLITAGDAYHYSHHSTPAILPAWRVIFADRQHTRLYFDPRTGELIDYVDRDSRAFRWWHLGLHRLDFAGLSARPLWDVVMLILLTGVALVCGIGAWMGGRRLLRSF